MNKKICNNPNVDMYSIDLDLNNRWEELLNDANRGIFIFESFFELVKDTHKYIKNYDNAESIPRSALLLYNLLYRIKDNAYYIDYSGEFYCATQIAGLVCELLTDGFTGIKSANMYNIEDDLCARWELMLQLMAESGAFDYEFFHVLAADTYSFINKYNKKLIVPRATPKLMALLHDFSYACLIRDNKTADITREIADEFNEQLLSGLVIETDEKQRRLFIVRAEKIYHLDALSFDITEIENERPDSDDDLPF